MPKNLQLNLGGEGEVPDCINQQPHWRDLTAPISRNVNDPLSSLSHLGVPFLFCDHSNLPVPDSVIDSVRTNSVPIDMPQNLFGPTIPSSEIKRVLKPGGAWIDNGITVFTKP